MDPLTPHDPADCVALYALIRDDISTKVVGHEHVIRRLALLGTRHLAGAEMSRALLIGPPGCGKTSLVRALADALGLPYLSIDIGMMAEQNWSGTDLSGHLAILIESLRREHTMDDALRLAERGVLLADEVDKLRIPPGASASTHDYRLGKQQTALALFGGGAIPVEIIGSRAQWSSRRALVVGAGVFDGLPRGNQTTADLIAWGMIPELAERLALGGIFRLRALSGRELAAVFRAGLADASLSCRRFGYFLEVSDETLRYAAARIDASDGALGPRSALGWLIGAVEDALVRLLEWQAPAGTALVLSPDDLRMPSR